MNHKILSLLGIAAATTGMTVGATSAQASTLGPGIVSLEAAQGLYFSNNIVDFVLDGSFTPNLGIAGDANVTTPPNPNDPDAGIYGIIPGNPSTYPAISSLDEVLTKLGTRSFVGADVKVQDIIFPFFVNNNVTYDLTNGGAVEGFTFLDFDTDNNGAGDGNFGVGTGDFSYIATSFTRIVEPASGGGQNIIFDLEGFFRDGAGNFKDTPSIFSLFNGVSSVDPQTLPVLTAAQFAALAGTGDPSIRFIASADGQIQTPGREAPEPGTIIGLTAVAGLGLVNRLKRKAK